jgi:hypothetical protein
VDIFFGLTKFLLKEIGRQLPFAAGLDLAFGHASQDRQHFE